MWIPAKLKNYCCLINMKIPNFFNFFNIQSSIKGLPNSRHNLVHEISFSFTWKLFRAHEPKFPSKLEFGVFWFDHISKPILCNNNLTLIIYLRKCTNYYHSDFSEPTLPLLVKPSALVLLPLQKQVPNTNAQKSITNFILPDKLLR